MTALAVTTSLRKSEHLSAKGIEISRELNIPLIFRKDKSIKELLHEYLLDGIIMVESEKISYIHPHGEFFFHPGMVKLRINEILHGKTDQMIKALDLLPGDTVLDCTLGIGSDAIVISYLNELGKVTGLEKSPVIGMIVREGLSSYQGRNSKMQEAMRRIQVSCTDYNDFLKKQPDNSIDIIYFDPMFRFPKTKSNAIGAIRTLADNSPLSKEILQEALRVTRRRVIIKEGRNSPEFLRLGITNISGGKYSPIAYGILEKRGGRY